MKKNLLISEKHKNICKILNYTEHLLILTSTVTAYVCIFVLFFWDGIPVVVAGSETTIITCAIATEIKKYKLII